MARRDPNDVAREQGYRNAYHRRIEHAREKAIKEGAQVDLAALRGHGSISEERQRREASGRDWSESTYDRLVNFGKVKGNEDQERGGGDIRERVENLKEHGATYQEIRSILSAQNKVFDAYHSGKPMAEVYALMWEVYEMAEDFGVSDDASWVWYH